MTLDADTLERLVPDELDPADDAGLDTLRLHLDRYAFAARQARPGRVLDLACGVGYGSHILAEEIEGGSELLGVDVSEEAVGYARAHYQGERNRFVVCDAMQFEDSDGFDTIVSLETVEHLPDPAGFLSRLVGLLRPGGVLVASVPTTPSVDLNPHHLHDFTARSFRAMGASRGLEEIAALPQIQRISVGDVLRGDRFKRDNLRTNLPGYYLAHPGAFVRRVATVLRHGLANHYLTLAWTR